MIYGSKVGSFDKFMVVISNRAFESWLSTLSTGGGLVIYSHVCQWPMRPKSFFFRYYFKERCAGLNLVQLLFIEIQIFFVVSQNLKPEILLPGTWRAKSATSRQKTLGKPDETRHTLIGTWNIKYDCIGIESRKQLGAEPGIVSYLWYDLD